MFLRNRSIPRIWSSMISQQTVTWRPHARVRSYTPISTSSYELSTRNTPSRRDSNTTLHSTFIVRNPAASHGRLLLQLPFPGTPGLSIFQMNDELSTVQAFIEQVQSMDSSLKNVEITTTNGIKIARSMHLRELVGMDFILRLNNMSITIENEGTKADTQQRHESIGFARLKASIEKDSRPYLPLEEYYKICLNAGAEEAVANKWLRELQRRKLVVHFDRSTNPQLQQAIILRPDGTESGLILQNALDSELYNIKHSRQIQEQVLEALESDMKKAISMESETRKLARQLPNTGKWLVFTGISSFYGVLMYLVWDVYSWDVMEPITYFIGFTGVLANSFYHSMTKRDATYSNIWHKHYQQRWARICEERRYNPKKTKELEERIQEIQQDVDLLIHLEGKRVQKKLIL